MKQHIHKWDFLLPHTTDSSMKLGFSWLNLPLWTCGIMICMHVIVIQQKLWLSRSDSNTVASCTDPGWIRSRGVHKIILSLGLHTWLVYSLAHCAIFLCSCKDIAHLLLHRVPIISDSRNHTLHSLISARKFKLVLSPMAGMVESCLQASAQPVNCGRKCK